MSTEEKTFNAKRVKRLAKKALGDQPVKISSSGCEILTSVVTEFVELMSLAGLDFSEHPKQYVDSGGVIKALNELGFSDIAEQLPDLSMYTEDMCKT
ncbi:hypothetical protein GPJ56_005486 [Histomonas meleagridis]|uniref:uncharacterized protein n=1 Tax=Histomonas meleagridis TaxID=135588 RepID=UPI00355A1508|nr:hypothetical protein GPJ56_005486 [Histomonas meleagridis]KAH0802510.1 hypothetical protein GO595_004559 [Histomonas meleagridis]